MYTGHPLLSATGLPETARTRFRVDSIVILALVFLLICMVVRLRKPLEGLQPL